MKLLQKILHQFGIYSLQEKIDLCEERITKMRQGQIDREQLIKDVKAIYAAAADSETREMLGTSLRQHEEAEARLETTIVDLETQVSKMKLKIIP